MISRDYILSYAKPSRSYAQYPFKEVIQNDCYKTAGYRNLRIDTVFDVGANIGMFAIKANDLFPKAKIHCYEPVPETFEDLSYNLAKLCPSAVPHKVGVGRITASNNIYYRREGFSGDFSIGAPNKVSNKLHSSMALLLSTEDFVARKECRNAGRYIVKMDIEGGEINFIRSKAGEDFINRSVLSVFEFHCFELPKAMIVGMMKSKFGTRFKVWKSGVSSKTFMAMVDNR
tara:strand:+ start:3077 stop:3766 length:690 start_codon:yes stop_codon:yes gene_type:complete